MQDNLMRRPVAVIAVILLVAVAWRLIPARQSVGPPASKFMRCKNNLKQIGLALRGYRDHHGVLPPAFIADQEGKPAHSWRVLILPFMDQQALYDRYRFDEPWDGPHNAQLADLMPPAYRCPSMADPDSRRKHTSYLAIVAPDSVMSGTIPGGIGATAESQAGAILVTESDARTVPWMSPRDLAPDHVFADLEPGVCPHTRGVNVLLADGSVAFLPQDTSKDEFLGLVSRSGGKPAVALDSHP